jgi:hypothetical protein
VIQIAPARVARGMSLPDLKCEGQPPYVICSEFPDGAIAVATLPRVSADRKFYYPLADVTIQAKSSDNTFGIFGRFKSLLIADDGEKYSPEIQFEKDFFRNILLTKCSLCNILL